MNWKFTTAAELLARISESGMASPEYLVARDVFYTGVSPESIRGEIARRIQVTRASLEKGMREPQMSFSGLTKGAAGGCQAECLGAAGIRSAIPFDEVVGAMRAIGDAMPSAIRESAEGGLAVTPTGMSYREKVR